MCTASTAGFSRALNVLDGKSASGRADDTVTANSSCCAIRAPALGVVSEEGEDRAGCERPPDQFTELAKIPAMEGKTWNHPVLAGDRLLVRNDHEMVRVSVYPLERPLTEIGSNRSSSQIHH